MNLKQLDLTSLEKAITSLDEAVTEHGKQPTNKFIRDAAIGLLLSKHSKPIVNKP